MATGAHALAEERFHALEAVSGPVLEKFPANGDFRDLTWNARGALVEVREARGDAAGALTDNEQVIAAFLQLLDEWPDYHTLFLAHAANLQRKARLLLKLDRAAEASTVSEQALTVIREQLVTDPAHRTKLDQLSTLLMQHSHIRRALHDDAGALASLEEARGICERVLLFSPWVFPLYTRRAEILTLLEPLRARDHAGEAAFLRRYVKELLINTTVAHGEMEYMRRLLGILREARASIATAEGEAAAAAWWAEQVTLLRHFLPGGRAWIEGTDTQWEWIIGEMEKP